MTIERPKTLLESEPTSSQTPRRSLRPLLTRLHFYAAIFVAPFILVAAISGMLYAASPQLEKVVYHDELYNDSSGAAQPLADQIRSARTAEPNLALLAVQPAPEDGMNTRVLFDDGRTEQSRRLAVFVDPISGETEGTLTSYGSSGALPFRTWIDELHRGLHLGDPGRIYSELAASWLWIIALAGLVLWWSGPRRRRRLRPGGDGTSGSRRRTLSWHGAVGTWVVVGMLGLSATGLTWSQYAGANVTELRTQLAWMAPELATGTAPAGLHQGHGGAGSGATASAVPAAASDPTTYDQVLTAARNAGIDADKVEILAAAEAGQAWTVTEVDRGWPTQVDAVSIDPQSLAVVDEVRFAEYPFMAKMARWGIDAHMGALFGLPNQILLAGVGTGLVLMIGWGYRMWWQRRPRHGSALRFGSPFPRGALRRLPLPVLVLAGLGVLLVGWFLPLLGLSVLAFLAVDALLALRARHRHRQEAAAG